MVQRNVPKHVLDYEPTRRLSPEGTTFRTSKLRTLLKTFFAWLLGPLHREEIRAEDFDDLTLFHWVTRTSHWDRKTIPLDGSVVKKLFLSGTDSKESETYCVTQIIEYCDGIPQPKKVVDGNPTYLVIGKLSEKYVQIRTVVEQLYADVRPDGFSSVVSITPSLLRKLVRHPQFERLEESLKHRGGGYRITFVPQGNGREVKVVLESRLESQRSRERTLRRVA